MKKMWLILSVVITLGFSGCEKTPVETGGEKAKSYSLVGEWYVYHVDWDGRISKLVGEAIFTENTIYAQYDFADTTVIIDSEYEIHEKIFEYEDEHVIYKDTSQYIRRFGNFISKLGEQSDFLDYQFRFISKDTVEVRTFIYNPNLQLYDAILPDYNAILVHKGGQNNEK